MQETAARSTPPRKRPDAADVLQVGATLTAQASLMASAQQARDARKAIKVKDLKVAAREAGLPGRSQLRNKDALLTALNKAGVKQVGKQAVGKAIGIANPAIMIGASMMSASGAYSTARASGASQEMALTAGAVAASPHAIAAAAPSLIGKFAPALASGLSKLALPMMGVAAGVGAARAGFKAYQDGKGAGGIAGAAALGAADTLSFGLASKAVDKMTGKAPAPVAPSAQTTTSQSGGDPMTVNMAKAAGQIPIERTPADRIPYPVPGRGRKAKEQGLRGGEGDDKLDGGSEMAKKPAQMIEDPVLLRPENDARMGPKEKAVTNALGNGALAQAGTRYQRALIKGEQKGDPLAKVLANANRESIDAKQNKVKGATGRVAKSGEFASAVENYPNQDFAGRVEGINTGSEVDDVPGRSRSQKAGQHYESFRQAGSNVIARRHELGQQDAKKGADGISSAAKRTGANVDIQREAWDTMLRGNPDLAKQLGPEGSKFRPQSPADIQRAFDAIHVGSGGRCDGRGQVMSPADTQRFQDANAHYESSHMGAQAEQPQASGQGKRGFANPVVQGAAQEARGVKNKTDWAK